MDCSDRPNWHLKSKRRVCPNSSLLNEGGFAAWTNVPAVGTRDPYNSVGGKPLIRVFPGASNSRGHEFDATGIVGGRRIVRYERAAERPEGKRTYSAPPSCLVGRESPHGRSGVRQVNARPAPRLTNPNTMQSAKPPRPEGVRMVHRTASYRIWQPDQLPGASWHPGCRTIRDAAGAPMRDRSTPNAWPAWPGYPPSHDAKTGAAVDYALAHHGGPFRKLNKAHPDVVASQMNCIRASNAPNEGMRCRHAGDRYY